MHVHFPETVPIMRVPCCLPCRYLEYEKEHGDATSVTHVKQLAMEFVKASANA